MTRSVYFTGGGSGGHVVPARTLIEDLAQDQNYSLRYIGGHKGVEADIMPTLVEHYYGISTGKLRRYLSWENFKDLVRVFLGFFDAWKILINAPKDSLVFSFGGFVSVPAVLAARMCGLEVFVHEQTTRAGLANKIAAKVASKIFLSFESSKVFYPASKIVLSGYPIRERFFHGPWSERIVLEGQAINLTEKPTLFVTGGGNGAECLNRIVTENLTKLLEDFQVVHQVGGVHIEKYRAFKCPGYYPVAFVRDEMVDLMRNSRVVLARAGAGTVCELMALGKKAIFIPLAIAQKNEQYHNAIEAQQKNGSFVIEEKDVATTNWVELFRSFLGENQLAPTIGSSAKEVLLEAIKKRNWHS